MRINHNIEAMTICRNMSMIADRKSIAVERLSTGLRINRAADDPAGLSISQKMEAQIRGLRQGTRNAQDGISLIQVAEGSLNEAHSILQRMRELTVQSANDTNTDEERNAIKAEMDQMVEELKRISGSTEFNEKKLLDGSTSSINLQIGPNAGDNIVVNMGNLSAIVSVIGTVDISSHDAATQTLSRLDKAINGVSNQRGNLGAYQNRLEHVINMNENYEENLTAAQSRIMDADMAAEMMEYAKCNILEQVNMALLSQSNNQYKGILKLLESL